jgi:hypothetical protein
VCRQCLEDYHCPVGMDCEAYVCRPDYDPDPPDAGAAGGAAGASAGAGAGADAGADAGGGSPGVDPT